VSAGIQFARLAALACGLALAHPTAAGAQSAVPSAAAQRAAAHATDTYLDQAVTTLAELVAFRTVARPGIPNAFNLEFRAMTSYLEAKARELGLDFADHGAVVVIGLGDADRRLGLITHADVQPADAAKWAANPFTLDTISEPGRLVARGTEDDKGPIVAALYAMRAVRDLEIPLARRVELIVSYSEESDWAPFQRFLAMNPPPDLNVALDSEYPVVTAEKGWNAVTIRFPARDADADEGTEPRLVSFQGGAFASQVPEDARAVIVSHTLALERVLRERATADDRVTYTFSGEGDSLIVTARGVAAHSSKPWDGVNAVTHLAAVLGSEWPSTPAARLVRLTNDLIGTEDYAERFGEVAYTHDFMGPLTLALTLVGKGNDGVLTATVNIRSPVGRSGDDLDSLIHEAIEGWEGTTGLDVEFTTVITPPYFPEDAPHVPVLLDVFRFYSGQQDAQPIAIGGGTHARLVPNGVNFGPAMPGQPYTGHSEHEYLSRADFRLALAMYADFRLALAMYAAALVELAGR
jgi:dipeptidase D